MKSVTEIDFAGKRTEYTMPDTVYHAVVKSDQDGRDEVDQAAIRLWRIMTYSISVASTAKRGTKDNVTHTARAELCAEVLSSMYGGTKRNWLAEAFTYS